MANISLLLVLIKKPAKVGFFIKMYNGIVKLLLLNILGDLPIDSINIWLNKYLMIFNKLVLTLPKNCVNC